MLGLRPDPTPSWTGRTGPGLFRFNFASSVRLYSGDTVSVPARTSWLLYGGGGTNGAVANHSVTDVWLTVDDGATWRFVTNTSVAPANTMFYHYRGRASCASTVDNYFYMFGGTVEVATGETPFTLDDLWASTNGASWARRNAVSGRQFSARSYSTCVTTSTKGELIVAAGETAYTDPTGDVRAFANDVYYSADYGVTFTRLANAAWSERGATQLGLVSNAGVNKIDLIYIIGGMEETDRTEVVNDVTAEQATRTVMLRSALLLTSLLASVLCVVCCVLGLDQF